jgi:branched-chain amino acid transport system permease protein
MYAYFIPFSSSSFYLPLTFFTVAMLIIGGRNSLWGAVTGSVLISFLSEIFRRLESGTKLAGVHLSIPSGSTELLIAFSMLLVLILRPDGITGGKEFRLQSARWRGRGSAEAIHPEGVRRKAAEEETAGPPADRPA